MLDPSCLHPGMGWTDPALDANPDQTNQERPLGE